jgi:hypothetical protein
MIKVGVGSGFLLDIRHFPSPCALAPASGGRLGGLEAPTPAPPVAALITLAIRNSLEVKVCLSDTFSFSFDFRQHKTLGAFLVTTIECRF